MHLLVTRSTNLDEAAPAVDLEQTPAELVVLSFSDSDLSALATAWQANRAQLPSLRLASLKTLRHPLSVDLYIERVVQHAKAVIVRCLGGLDYWRYGLEQIGALARERGIVFAALPGDDRPDGRLAELSAVGSDVLALLDRFFRDGGPDNLEQALRFVSGLVGSPRPWRTPSAIPAAIEWQPPGEARPRADVSPPGPARPAALVVFYRSALLAADTAPIAALVGALAAENMRPLAVAVTSLKDPAAIGEVERLITEHRPAVILNTTAFSALRADDTTVLDAADVPVLQVVLSGSSREDWAASPRGLSPSDLAMNVVLPELDGRLFTRAISFKAETMLDPALEHAPVRHMPDIGRVEYVARLAKAWVRLAVTPRADRRLALVLSDYPARDGRTGYAVGLDTAQSVIEILGLLRGAGYDVGHADPDVTGLLRGGGDEIAVPLTAYRRWRADLPEGAREEITVTWGEPGNDPALRAGAFRFRVLHAGKVTVLVQPDRGALGVRKAAYHDTNLPPRHAYVALYAWLREARRVHAMIHLGTHGTFEWLPGKALALSDECYPEALLGPLPVIYPFIVNNPGEAVQAKRRLAAVTIGHLTPPLSAAGLHGAMSDLEGLVEEYASADGLDRRRLSLLEREILDRAARSGLAAECGITPADSPNAAIAKLDARLCDIKELAIRDSFHVFGRMPDADVRDRLVEAMRRASGAEAQADGTDRIAQLMEASAAAERASLLVALDGRRVAPGPAGAPTRGRADVLPTGRNLTTIDPRAIPTRTAAVIGARGVDEVIRRYLQDHGEYPRSLVLDLWASASLRTGGDDLAQGLAYLGVRPTWDAGSSRVTGVEVLAAANLDRPRIDVTLRISGLFRDVFPTQIALFWEAVRLVASLDEEDEMNPLAAARRRGEALVRVFGSAPGVYGAGAADLMLDGDWQAREDIARTYLATSSHAHGPDGASPLAADAFRDRVREADAHVHPQDDRERDLLDGDGVADYVGGFAAAAAGLGGHPALYHLDTSQPEAPRAHPVSEEVARIVRGRLVNPKWIAGMLRHGHRGVAEMAQGVDALFAFAAAARVVPGHLFDAVHEAYFASDEVGSAMMRANPDATEAMARRLEEAIDRRLWTPRRNAVRDELVRVRACRQPVHAGDGVVS
jgi:cobaltochelatase CobN